MYCKYCGKVIADDSKFCQHCGGKQDSAIDSETNEKSTTEEKKTNNKVIEIPTIKTNLSDKTKWLLFGYAIWFVFNLYWLFTGDKSGYAAQYFQPFADVPYGSDSYYDISEFIVYVVGVPLLIWGAIMIGRRFKEKNISIPKSMKNYLIMIAVALFAIIAIFSMVVHSDDEDDTFQEYNPRTISQTQQSVPTQDNDIDSKLLEDRFDDHLDDFNKQMDEITKQRIQQQIENLPSEKEDY